MSSLKRKLSSVDGPNRHQRVDGIGSGVVVEDKSTGSFVDTGGTIESSLVQLEETHLGSANVILLDHLLCMLTIMLQEGETMMVCVVAPMLIMFSVEGLLVVGHHLFMWMNLSLDNRNANSR